jgi:uncharacterized spore protein YtfJ
MSFTQGYKEKVSDEEVISIIETGITSSVGDWLNSADMAKERIKSTFEYGMLPAGHLSPQGVSQIVSSDTVEAIEGFLAILSELLLNNNKLARFIPFDKKPTAVHQAMQAADLTNYVIFKQNNGWELLNTWMKAALLWKNSVIRWEYIEEYDYKFEDYDEIDQVSLDNRLAEEGTEMISHKGPEQVLSEIDEGVNEYLTMYYDVRLRTKVNKSRIKISNVHPEAFRITRDAHNLDDATFVGIQVEMTRSEIRKNYPEMADDINWDDIGDGSSSWAVKYIEEQATRKKLTGQEYWMGAHAKEIFPTEANRSINVIECWIRVDRDGDGIAELKRFIIAGSTILLEEDVDCIPLAVLVPFEVPHEFFGLSVADMIRPATMASTAILRGFVENVYLTNYSPKLADPNVVDFSALQNMKPKQIIATNGNPNGAVASMTPDAISTGTVPLLEVLQLHKEQATGLSKAAQGLNDTLYVSGNSEEKMQSAMSAAQVRIQYMARRFVETGFKRLVEGVYKMVKEKMSGTTIDYFDHNNYLQSIDPITLPDNMLIAIDADVGENGNSNTVKKMAIVGQQLLPALRDAGAGAAVRPEAAVNIAAKTLEALDLDPLEYMVDFTTDEFKQMAEQSRKNEEEAANKLKALEEQMRQVSLMQQQSTVALTNVQAKNSLQDNTRQLMVALDKHFQEWAKISIQAAKEGAPAPEKPNPKELFRLATMAIQQDASMPIGTPQPQVDGPPASMPM